ncbi:MAG: bifunctional folylpolyglutamate synthase/dihydrofolate synthase [Bryobacterales bacterium]|nr:bifunctional folylpolyglutamate synthase/dihydrofolate synthase [Bryobacterales bacterium]
MTYPDSVRYLYSLGNEVKTIKLGLDRIGTVLEHLGHPERKYRVVHVAGTNGKGSTCAMIAAGLQAAGLRTGLYTSPHLIEPTERIQIEARSVSEAEFLGSFRKVHECAMELVDRGIIDGHPTYFETVTAMAFDQFVSQSVDIAVVEVGLGGRLDATNVVRPELTVITPIDFDHEQYLGNTLTLIAGEKAGILKPGVRGVIAPQAAEAMERIREEAALVGAPLEEVADWPVENLEIGPFGSRYQSRGLEVVCPLAGEHQVVNSLTAAVALTQLEVPVQGIAEARWPGRLERVAERPDIILDGAHNPAGVRALVAYIRRFFGDKKIWLVYGTMRDKSVDEVIGNLSQVATEVIATQVDLPRALRPAAVAEMFDHPRVRTAPNVRAAFEMIRREAAPTDVAFVTGSLFLVGEARKITRTGVS